MTVAATVASTLALDVVATALGVVFAAAHLLDGASPAGVVGLLGASYVMWAAAMRVSLTANWRLLEATGTSTNLLSKTMFELARHRSWNERRARGASAAGYLVTELGKEVPYYVGAFGTALLSDTVASNDALVFLIGTNVGAAIYEYGVGSLTGVALERRSRHPPPGATVRSVGTAADTAAASP